MLALHDVGYLLREPYWNDETWVAVTTRFPLAQLPEITSSTPIGWSFLLRLVTFGHSESGRLLPLAFAGLAVVPGYWLARRLAWKDRRTGMVAAVLGAAAVLLVPAMVVRDDLKQYTADACMTLLILAATARLERQWSRRSLGLLSVTVWGGMLVSDAAAFTGAAALAAICLIQLVRRNWRRLADAAVTAVGTAALGAVVYQAFDAQAVGPGLTAYWHAYFVPVHQGLGASASFVAGRFELVHRVLGPGPAWLAIALLVAGLVTIARLGRPATAVAVAALWPEMIILAALGKYPFLDVRTSTFLLTATTLVAAIGVAGVCAVLRAAFRGGKLASVLAAAVAASALAGLCLSAAHFARGQPIPANGISQQAQYVASHAARRDQIVVSANDSWGFAYYWPEGRPAIMPDLANLQRYEPVFPAQPRIVVARNRAAASIRAAMAQALAMLPAGRCSRIWLVRSRMKAPDYAAWLRVLADLHLSTSYAPYGLAYIQAGPASCSRSVAGRG